MQQKFPRTGPRPLWLHLNAGAAMMAAVSENQNMVSASAEILKHALNGVEK